MSDIKDFVIENGVLMKYTGNETNVVIPEGVTSIGGWAFSRCTGLTNIEIPDSVTSIGDNAFRDCENLTSITIPDSVTSIGGYAFRGCTSLTSITIPDSVTSIGIFAFSGCSGLESIVVDEDNPVYDSRNGCNAIIETKTNKLIAGCSNTLIPNSVTSIGDNAFEYCIGLTSVTIPDSVTSIGWHAFYGCSGLTHLTIPDSVCEIDDAAFSHCTGLTAVNISSNLKTIHENLFYYCTALKNIVIPASVKEIEKWAFRICYKLEMVEILNSECVMHKLAFEDCDRLTLIIKDAPISIVNKNFKTAAVFGFVKNIGIYDDEIKASYQKYINSQRKKLYAEIPKCHELLHYMLENNIIPVEDCETVIEIIKDKIELLAEFMEYRNSNFSFEQMEKSQKKAINKELNANPYDPVKLKKLWKFEKNKKGEMVITCYKGTEEDVIVPERIGDDPVIEIGNDTFSFYAKKILNSEARRHIKTIELPNTIKRIGENAFYGCFELTSISIPEKVTQIGNRAFYCCDSLEKIDLPSKLSKIGKEAFAKCSSLVEIVIPNKVKVVSEGLFSQCEQLQKVTLPENLMQMDYSAFGSCPKLKELTIPTAFKGPLDDIFGLKPAIEDIYFLGSETQITKYALLYCDDVTIHAPASSFAEQYAKENNIPFIAE